MIETTTEQVFFVKISQQDVDKILKEIFPLDGNSFPALQELAKSIKQAAEDF